MATYRVASPQHATGYWNLIIKNTMVTLCCIMMQSASFGLANMEGIQVYQKNLHLSEEHKQKLANDIDRYHNANNLWDVLSDEFSLPHYEDNAEVQEQIDWFLHHPESLTEATSRAGPYLYFILQQARKRHLPTEVVLLPMIESAYNPFAYSSAGASGLWQMMPGTASGFGIKQDWWYDGRRDVVASTRAALDYLAYLGSFFDGNWLLAIAAYDTGEGNVLSAIKKNIRDGKKTDFWSLPLAQETRNYIPRLLALATIISHPERYPVNWPSIPNAPYLAQVDVGGQINLNDAANLASISLKNLKQLNPGYNQSATDPHGLHKLILPIENVIEFTENLARSPLSKKLLESEKSNASSDSLPSKNTYDEKNNRLTNGVIKHIQSHYNIQPGDTLYMVRKGDTLEKIAQRFHTNTLNISAINQLGAHNKITAGDKLIIPTHESEQPQQRELSPGDTIYMVRKDDTVEKIAKKFHTTSTAVRVINLLADDNVQEGDRLVIPKKVS